MLPLPAGVDAGQVGKWSGRLVAGSDGALYCAPSSAREGVLRVDGGAMQRRLVAALQRLALARAIYGAGSARWSSGGPVAAAIDELPSVTSITAGAPERPLLLDVRHALAALPCGQAAPQAVVQRRAAAAEAEVEASAVEAAALEV